MKRAVLIILLILFLAGCLGGLAYSVYHFFFKPNNTVVPAFRERSIHMVIEGEEITSGEEPRVVDEEILLPMSIIKKYFDPYIYWDAKLKKLTVTTKDRVIRMKTDSLDALVNNKPMTLDIPASEENGTVYVPIEFLGDFYNIEIQYLKENSVIIIDYKNSIRQLAEPISANAAVRKGRSIRYPVIKKFDLQNSNAEENILRIFEEYDKWYKVRTSDGAIGYIEKRFVVVRRMLVKKLPEPENKSASWKPEKGKINLVWDMIYGKLPDLSKEGRIEGLDVVSPTWFQLANEHGKLINRSSSKYVDWAHKNGYKVWALFGNDFGNIEMTEKFLNNTDARENAIREILTYAALYKLDGINIDFENMYKKDKDAFTQFVRELSPLLREQGLVVSVDVSVPDGSETWSLCYDRKALGEAVDYVMLMAYDQHWRTSPKAGSVAQVAWVERNVKKLLEMVPGEKLLLGLPFYTRLWMEESSGGGKVKVSNPKVLSMDAAKKMIDENNASVKWDEESGQFYAEFDKDGATYKIWVEDEASINLKSALVHKYRLAGTAAWRKGDENEAVWSMLNENMKDIESYAEWKSRNAGNRLAYNN